MERDSKRPAFGPPAFESGVAWFRRDDGRFGLRVGAGRWFGGAPISNRLAAIDPAHRREFQSET